MIQGHWQLSLAETLGTRPVLCSLLFNKLLWQILKFSCVPSPSPLSPCAAEPAEQDASLQPRSPGVSLKLQVGFHYHIACAADVALPALLQGQEQREQDVAT